MHPTEHIKETSIMKMINDCTGQYNWLKRTRRQTKLNCPILKMLLVWFFFFFLERCTLSLWWRQFCSIHWIKFIHFVGDDMAFIHSHMRHHQTEHISNGKTLQWFFVVAFLILKLDTITMKNWPAFRNQVRCIKNGYEWKCNENDDRI